MPIPPRDALWNAVAGLAQLLLHEESVTTTLQRVATSAVTLVEAVEEAGVTVAHDDRPYTDAATGGIVYEIDNFQYDIDQGPCLHALVTGDVVEVPCMRADQRWPTFAQFAADRDINSSLSIPLTARGGPSIATPVVGAPSISAAIRDGRVGVVNLYSRREAPFSQEERWAALTFAEQAAVAIFNARTYEAARELTEQMQGALGSRAIFEQAKGILMGRSRITADEAFECLRKQSQSENRKLRDVAQALVDDVTPGSGDDTEA
jgi:GAF domain-containing protein